MRTLLATRRMAQSTRIRPHPPQPSAHWTTRRHTVNRHFPRRGKVDCKHAKRHIFRHTHHLLHRRAQPPPARNQPRRPASQANTRTNRPHTVHPVFRTTALRRFRRKLHQPVVARTALLRREFYSQQQPYRMERSRRSLKPPSIGTP